MVAYGFKKQFIVPIKMGLGESYEVDDIVNVNASPKRQTIRAIGKRRHARPGEAVQLYYAMRTKECRKLGEAPCKSIEPVRISVQGNQVMLPERGRILDGEYLDDFARDDGFADWPAMKQFWQKEHGELVRLGPWVGVLIRWEPLHG